MPKMWFPSFSFALERQFRGPENDVGAFPSMHRANSTEVLAPPRHVLQVHSTSRGCSWLVVDASFSKEKLPTCRTGVFPGSIMSQITLPEWFAIIKKR